MYSIKDIDGIELDPSLYLIDIEKKTFYSDMSGLIIDFRGYDCWSFDTYGYCKFITGNNCKFDTTSNCEFNVGNNCTLKCWTIDKQYDFKLNKGIHVFSNDLLYRDIDKNWAILNSRHDNGFIRQTCHNLLQNCH